MTRFTGLIAATHTAMNRDGTINLDAIEKQAAHLLANGITAAFVCGSTGEAHSLSVDERRRIAQRWSEVVQGSSLKLIVHVGHNSLPEAQALATHAGQLRADAISALAPNYFKPATVTDLAEFCTRIASTAPETPFYFYDIPALTGVNLPMIDFIAVAHERMPTFAGLKFTNPDFTALQRCLAHGDGAFDILYGNDEILLAALAFGVRGAVGSTYNVLAPRFHRLMAAFQAGDLQTARAEQLKCVQYVETCAAFGYLRAAKAAMKLFGIDCGPVRLPLQPLEAQQEAKLFEALAGGELFLR